ncbi:hypothetical protein BH10BAC2_BH10BAC2_17320 [soil metagenome]
MPGVKVGTIITFNSLNDHCEVFNTLTPNSDFIFYIYYPTNNTSPNWQMRPRTDVIADIRFMAKKPEANHLLLLKLVIHHQQKIILQTNYKRNL